MHRWRKLAAALLLAVSVATAYLPALSGGFILDDDLLLTANPLVKATDGWYRLWNPVEALDAWPVTATSFWLEWRVWGMQPAGYHATNIVLHIFTALLFWSILQRLLAARSDAPQRIVPAAYFAALLFALHPVNVQSVAWITQRKNLLAMLFLLLCIGCFLRSEESVRRGPDSPPRSSARAWYLTSLLAFLLAILSKGSVAVLPLLLPVILAWRRPLRWHDGLRLLPFLATSLLLVPVNVWVQAQRMNPTARSLPMLERLLGAGGVLWFYLGKALLPVKLSFVYGQWQITREWQWWLPLFGVAGITALLWYGRRTWGRALLLAWAFFAIALLPVMGLTDSVYIVEQSLVADHYQHIALMAVVTVVAAAWGSWQQTSQGSRRWLPTALAAAVLVLFASLTWQQSALYRDNLTLFADALRKNPHSAVAHHNLAFLLAQSGRLAEAAEHYERALQLQPNYPEAHNNYGATLAQAKRPVAAISQFRQALALRPDHPGARNNLGALLHETGNSNEAISELKAALQLKPDFPEAHRNLANALLRLGHNSEALDHYRAALRLTQDPRRRQELVDLLARNAGNY